MLRILPDEYRDRMETLKTAVMRSGLPVFLVSSFDNMYYLTGAGFEPLERPFFLLVFQTDRLFCSSRGLSTCHMKEARTVAAEDIHTYWELPASGGRNWLDRLQAILGSVEEIGVEPALPHGIAAQLDPKQAHNQSANGQVARIKFEA